MVTCYRHPNRETGVSCSNCGRHICPDCMTTTAVGMRCPECSKQTTQVRHVRAAFDARPVVTIGLIAINVLVWFGMSSQSGSFSHAAGRIYVDGVLFGPLVHSEPWRLLTAGFLHDGPIHLGLNMYILWFLGNLLEPGLGPVRFGALYLASLFAGALGVLLLSPNSPTLGASGAVFGLMGAAFVMSRARGIDPMQSGIGPLILINLLFTLAFAGHVSIGGHLGGLVGGALAGFLIDQSARYRRDAVLPIAACVLVGAISVAGAFAVA